jgi:RNA polymerase primary sigma factor
MAIKTPRCHRDGRAASIRCCPKNLACIRDWIEREIPLIQHPLFELRDACARIEATRPASPDSPTSHSKSASGQAFIAGMVEAPLLTVDDERYLFTKMNYHKFVAEKIRRGLSLNRPDASLVDQIEENLRVSTEVRNRIVQSNLRLVVALARKFSGTTDQLSELVSEGTLPLIRAVQLFDVSRGYRFSTYATWAVRNQQLRSLKPRRDSARSVHGDDEGWENSLVAPEASTDNFERDAQLRSHVVREMLTLLTDREREIVAARFGLDDQPKNQSLNDIALQHGVSKERIRQILVRSIEKLQAGAKPTELP